MIGAMLQARAVLWNELTRLHRAMLKIARADPVWQRLMSAPGVRSSGCSHLSFGGRQSRAVCKVPNRRCVLRTDAQ
jgi:hypothetical protein